MHIALAANENSPAPTITAGPTNEKLYETETKTT